VEEPEDVIKSTKEQKKRKRKNKKYFKAFSD